MEVEAAGRRSAGAGGSGRAFRHRLRRIRRRILAIQRGEFAGEPAAGARPHRSMDEEESLNHVESLKYVLPGSPSYAGKKARSKVKETQAEPSAHARLWLARRQQGPAALELGRAPAASRARRATWLTTQTALSAPSTRMKP